MNFIKYYPYIIILKVSQILWLQKTKILFIFFYKIEEAHKIIRIIYKYIRNYLKERFESFGDKDLKILSEYLGKLSLI